jgi:hypothetical protein
MFIDMARHALTRQAQETPVRIPDFYVHFFGLLHVFRGVAFVAGEPQVLAVKRPARLAMVKFLLRWLPFDQRKFLSVMLRMTFGAVLTGRAFWNHFRVEPPAFIDSRGDFAVALEATKDLVSTSLMARGAAGCTL